MGRFHLVSLLPTDLTGMLLSFGGSATRADITNIRLYQDLGTAGVLDPSDVMLGSSVGSFITGTAAFTFPALDIQEPGIDLLAVGDVSASPNEGVLVSVATASEVTATTGGSPEIDLLSPPGSSIPDSGNHMVGSLYAGSATTLFFTVENKGTADLHLTGATPVTTSNQMNCNALVTLQPKGTLTPSETTTFTIDVTPLHDRRLRLLPGPGQ